MSERAVRWFQRCAYAWLVFYALSVLVLGEAAWSNAPVDMYPSGSMFHGVLPALLEAIDPVGGYILCMSLMVIGALLFRHHRVGVALLAWFLFRVMEQRLWLASNGGMQLMSTMLIWSALMGPQTYRPLRFFAFWAARLQLLLAYAAAAAHKLTGATWLEGTAMLRVANDPLFHLHWLTAFPVVCTIITYTLLAWMTLFPLAMWWWPSRRLVLCFGVAFHLLTAVFIGIPQMGLAFIACYALWWHRDTSTARGVISPP